MAYIKTTPLQNLEQLGLHLPEVSSPGGNYVSVNVRNDIAYVAIQFPIRDGAYFFQGRLGEGLTAADGYQAMAMCALNVLAQINSKVGFDKLVGLNHIDIYYVSVAPWDEAPAVANGASDLFANVLGEKGRHSRAIFGVASLPRNFSVGLTASFTVQQ